MIYFIVFILFFLSGCDDDPKEIRLKKDQDKKVLNDDKLKYCGKLKSGFMKTMNITFDVELKNQQSNKNVSLVIPEDATDLIPKECFSNYCSFDAIELKKDDKEIVLKLIKKTGFKTHCK